MSIFVLLLAAVREILQDAGMGHKKLVMWIAVGALCVGVGMLTLRSHRPHVSLPSATRTTTALKDHVQAQASFQLRERQLLIMIATFERLVKKAPDNQIAQQQLAKAKTLLDELRRSQ